jgi:hypothetical protein
MSSEIEALAKLHKSLDNQSLTLADRVKSLALRDSANVLLLDTSISMADHINSEERRIDALWSIVQQLQADGAKFRLSTFNSEFTWHDSGLTAVPEPGGGTWLHHALRRISHDYANTTLHTITVITDGEPAMPQTVLSTAATLLAKVKINVMFVGDPQNWQAIEFCKQLASQHNGTYGQSDMATEVAKALVAKTVRGALTDGTEKNAIAL